MKKSLAWVGTILMFVSSLTSLILSFGSGKIIWTALSWVAIALYSIALAILILDSYQTRSSK